MEQLEHVKKVEAEVAAEVEKARQKSEKELGEFKEECNRKYSLKVSETMEKTSEELDEAKADAEREASLIVEEAFREAGRVQNPAGGNFDAAVEFIIKKLGG